MTFRSGSANINCVGEVTGVTLSPHTKINKHLSDLSVCHNLFAVSVLTLSGAMWFWPRERSVWGRYQLSFSWHGFGFTLIKPNLGLLHGVPMVGIFYMYLWPWCETEFYFRAQKYIVIQKFMLMVGTWLLKHFACFSEICTLLYIIYVCKNQRLFIRWGTM